MQVHCLFFITLILGSNLGRNHAEDDLSIARWILALDSSAPELPSFSESSSSSEEDSIPSLESREENSAEENDDVSQVVAATEEDPTARVFIPDIGKVKTIVDILKTVGSVVVPIIIEGIEGVAAGIEPPQGEVEDRLPKDVVTFRSRGVMLLRNAKKGLDGFTPM